MNPAIIEFGAGDEDSGDEWVPIRLQPPSQQLRRGSQPRLASSLPGHGGQEWVLQAKQAGQM